VDCLQNHSSARIVNRNTSTASRKHEAQNNLIDVTKVSRA
jgi:hypothetical protein